ncbi:MAG: GTPase [Chloroflexi bacterium]|nr:GTPase [Chloroflexota bacterium]
MAPRRRTPPARPRTRVLILGAAGRDFHNFNMVFRRDPSYEVVAFTAHQIPDIAGRRYPPELAGALYPKGIPILTEEELPHLVKKRRVVSQVYLSYSDLSHLEVMHKASLALALGVDFCLLGPDRTTIRARVPVVSVCAVRTGAGKSPASRYVARFFRERGHRIVAVRHPMPYGDLRRQVCQRFASYEDMDRQRCTIEEREEYEPFLRMGMVVYAGVDYEQVIAKAQREADLLLWDGGNNDFPFVKPDLHIVLLDALRAGHEVSYYPGETNLLMADLLLLNKVDRATPEQTKTALRNAATLNPKAPVVKAVLDLAVDRPERIKGKRALIVGDGPTLTHGGMPVSAGTVATQRHGAKAIVDGRRLAVGSLRDTYRQYPHIQREVPAMGYSPAQIRELEETINRAACDIVVDATPTDLSRLIRVSKPIVNVEYELRPHGKGLDRALAAFEARWL